MKKVTLILLTLLMAVALITPAFADPGVFVSSPSIKGAPTLDSVEPDSSECQAELVITPYGERHTLSDEARAMLEDAYAQIANVSSADEFSKILAELAETFNLSGADVAVSDLFDIDTTHCANHDEHGGFTITIKVDDASKLVGILHMNQTKWEICDIYEINEEDNTVTFHGTEFSPFALVVATEGVELDRGGSNLWWIILLIILALVIAGALLWFFVFKKKKDDDEAAAEAAEK